jgi:hypothetical protein
MGQHSLCRPTRTQAPAVPSGGAFFSAVVPTPGGADMLPSKIAGGHLPTDATADKPKTYQVNCRKPAVKLA